MNIEGLCLLGRIGFDETYLRSAKENEPIPYIVDQNWLSPLTGSN